MSTGILMKINLPWDIFISLNACRIRISAVYVEKQGNIYNIINYYYFKEKFYNKEELIKHFGFSNFERCENEILEILYQFKQIESRTILFSESEFTLKDTFLFFNLKNTNTDIYLSQAY